jgi:hypothetical protein
MAKNLRRLILNERAITPVLSNLLLTVVAVAAMALATTATYVITSNLRDTMGERVIVEDLWFNNATQTIDIYVRNVGQVAVQVSHVYVNHVSQSFARPFILETGQHRWLNISLDWVSGSLYYVDVVTTRGTHIADYFEAPQT